MADVPAGVFVALGDDAGELVVEDEIMAKVKFTAQSMQDIVSHFEGIANAHADQAVQAKTVKAKTSHMAQAHAWAAAAHFLDGCEIVA